MQEEVSVIMHEVRPGLGNIDYGAYLRVLHELPQVVPLMLEHLSTQHEYDLGVDHIRAVAAAEEIPARLTAPPGGPWLCVLFGSPDVGEAYRGGVGLQP